MGFYQNDFLKTINLLSEVHEFNLPDCNAWEKLVNALEECRNNLTARWDIKFNFFNLIRWIELIEVEYVPMVRKALKEVIDEKGERALAFLKFLESFETFFDKIPKSVVDYCREFNDETVERFAVAVAEAHGYMDYLKQEIICRLRRDKIKC